MMRITVIETNSQRTTLRVEGQVVREWTGVLELEIENARQYSGVVQVDLSSVTATDLAASRMLRRIEKANVKIINIPKLLDFEEVDP